MKKLHITAMLIVFLSLSAQALFEVKDASDNTVFEISNDGLRVFNLGDTLMVISSSEIKAFILDSAKDKALSRSFSITTSTAQGKGQDDVVNIASDGLRVYSDNANLMDITKGNITAYIDTSYSFNVTSSDGGKLETDVLEVSAGATKMREGDAGERYSDFSPENIFLGLNAGQSNSSGIQNVYLGNNVGTENIEGSQNICIGDQAGKNNLSNFSIFIGTGAGFGNTSGVGNTFVGNQAGAMGTIGYSNTYLGWMTGLRNNGNNNTFIGNGAGMNVETGNSNVYIGDYAGGNNTDGDSNVFIGEDSGAWETGSNKLFIENSGISTPLIYGEFDNDLVRINGDFNVTGNSTFNGSARINTITSATDLHVLGSKTLGSLMIAPLEGSSGDDAEIVLAEDDDGTYNMSMKYDGGLNRLEWWGHQSGTDYGPLMYMAYSTTTGVGTLYSGKILPMGDNVWDLGASTLRWDDVYATNGTIQTSDKRLKSSVSDMEYGLDTILKMRPVTYFWKDKPERGRKVGLIAQDLLDLVPEIVDIGEDENHTLGLNYAELTPILIKALQEQQEEVEKLKNRLNEIEEILKKMDK